VVNARQFDVCRIAGLRRESPVDLAVVLQDDTLSHLGTRVVAPLVIAGPEAPIDRATPTTTIDTARYVIAIHLLTTVPLRNLSTFVVSLTPQEREIKAAIDLVFSGV
jgi:hypothetical protein